MFKFNVDKLDFLKGLFVTCLIVANVAASKVVQIGSFTIIAAVVAYPLLFLITDIISEEYGKEAALKTVHLGILCQITGLILFYLASLLPLAPFIQVDHFNAVVGSTVRVTLASLASYFVSQHIDVIIFHKLKEWTNGKMKWLRNNVSTFAGQIVDTVLFVVIAFYGVVPDLWVMIGSQLVVKWGIAVLDTPLFYFFTRSNRS